MYYKIMCYCFCYKNMLDNVFFLIFVNECLDLFFFFKKKIEGSLDLYSFFF